MSLKRSQNPYQTLRLKADASIYEVIERGKELSRETTDEEQQALYRRAVEEIRQHPVRRARNQFWEPQDTLYDDEAIIGFCDRYQSPPVTPQSLHERKMRFVEEDCSPRNLVTLAMPPIPFPDHPVSYLLEKVPQSDVEIPLQPWELFV